jgi:hypothetical protein
VIPTLLEALDDPDLFAPHFRGDTWRAWRAFLAALFALPMDDYALSIYRAHTGRQAEPRRPFTEAALIVGRRGGKSRVLALAAVFLACFRDYAPFLAPGEVATVAILAANRRQARSIFRFVSGLLKAVPLLAPMVAHETDEAIELVNRVVIEISTASFRTTRGYSFAAVLCDEVAFWQLEEASANPDTEILRALRPGMASMPGSILLLASSPYAKKGELYNAYRRHHGKDDARVLIWKASTGSMNPRVDPAIIEEAYLADEVAARSEYGAEFRDDLADYISREAVDAVTMWGRGELPPQSGVQCAAFVDPSGGVSDAMTLAVAHLGDGAVCVLDAVLEIRPPFDPETAVAECAALLRRFGVPKVMGDRYAGEWPRARFREHGIEFEQSARPKSDLYHDLLPLLNARRVELLDNSRLAAQLVGLERRTARSGRDSIDHAPGGHDDVANAVAGVLVGLDLDRRPALVRSKDMLADDRPVPVPAICKAIVAVLAADQDGGCAVTYWAHSPHVGHPLTLLNFDAAPLSAELFDRIMESMNELRRTCRPRYGAILFTMSEPLTRQALACGFKAATVPTPLVADPLRLGLAAASHVARGSVKIAIPAHEHAQISPLGGAFDIRGGESTDDPLRAALLAGIALSLDHASPAAGCSR